MTIDSTCRLSRRTTVCRLADLGLAACVIGAASPLRAQTRKRLASKAKIMIPGIARSNLDEAGRALGDTLVVLGLCDEIEYDNHDGKGGASAATYFAGKYARDPDALLMADTSLFSSIALQGAAVDLSLLHPIARITSDTLVVVVRSNSPIKTAADLGRMLKSDPQMVQLGIGAVGGVDHVVAGLLAREAGAPPAVSPFVPFARNFEFADAVAQGKLTAGVSGYRTFSADLASGRLRAIGVSSRKEAYGIRPLREHGLNVDLANWRALYMGHGVPKSRQAEVVEAVRMAVNDESWRRTLRQNYWDAAWLTGTDLATTLEIDISALQLAVRLLKLMG